MNNVKESVCGPAKTYDRNSYIAVYSGILREATPSSPPKALPLEQSYTRYIIRLLTEAERAPGDTSTMCEPSDDVRARDGQESTYVSLPHFVCFQQSVASYTPVMLYYCRVLVVYFFFVAQNNVTFMRLRTPISYLRDRSFDSHKIIMHARKSALDAAARGKYQTKK